MERAYTVKEIDALRAALEMRWLYGTTALSGMQGMSRSYGSEEKIVAVEELVRTHMLAGHTTKDIYDADNPSQSGDPQP
jgi:hypothetical protein